MADESRLLFTIKLRAALDWGSAQGLSAEEMLYTVVLETSQRLIDEAARTSC